MDRERHLYLINFDPERGGDYDGDTRCRATDDDTPNAVSSELVGTSMHAPVIDIDWPCRLEPSSTPGHFHLYIDKPMAWEQYIELLRALVLAGVVEPGYYSAALARKATFVRLPGVKKGA